MTRTAPASAELSRPTLALFRWILPAVVCLGGLIAFALNPSVLAAEGAAGVVGAGLSWMLLGWFFRVGAQGDEERHVEDAARDYLDEHGEWPTDEQYEIYARHGRWTAEPV